MTKRTLTPEQVAAHEAKRVAFKALCNRIADMSESERSALASQCTIVSVEGHTLSPHNQCLVAYQYPNATLVGGFAQWLKHGRCVRKGEHGLSIWVPTVRKGNEDSDDGGEGAPSTHFIMGTIFDVSQTETH